MNISREYGTRRWNFKQCMKTKKPVWIEIHKNQISCTKDCQGDVTVDHGRTILNSSMIKLIGQTTFKSNRKRKYGRETPLHLAHWSGKSCQEIKEMRDKNTTRVYDVPGYVLKLLGDGLRLRAQLNNIHETGEWPKYFTKVTMTALNKKP